MIFLFMEGAPSQMDLFDPKPELKRWNGKPLPPFHDENLKLAFIKPNATVLGSSFEFEKHGQCGMELSDSCRISAPAPTISASSARCTPKRSTITPASFPVHRSHGRRPSDDGRLGHATDLAANRRTFPASLSLSPESAPAPVPITSPAAFSVHLRRHAVPQPGRSDPLSVEPEGRLE